MKAFGPVLPYLLQNRIVLNATFLQLEDDEDLFTDDIVKIGISTRQH